MIRYAAISGRPTSPRYRQTASRRMRVEFGMAKDRGRRFALWALMHMLGVAPDLDVAFDDPADRDAARDFMEMTEPKGD